MHHPGAATQSGPRAAHHRRKIFSPRSGVLLYKEFGRVVREGEPVELELDIAVVGGGVSGVYSAWRLQEAHGNSERIALFEYSNRIGGRIFTVTMPGLPNVKAELGGMRYIKDQHPVVTSLIDHLRLATKPFPMGAPAPVGDNCNLVLSSRQTPAAARIG